FAVAAGKAAWSMVCGLDAPVRERVREGLVAGPRTGGLVLPSGFVQCEGAHPYPNEASVDAGRRALAIAEASSAGGGVLIVLLSGGASAMLALPAEGITLRDKVETVRLLMRAAVPIGRLNCVRKHLSGVKGGRLGAAAKHSLTLAISDVHDPVPDDPSVIGSGPTVPDRTTFGEALEVVERVPGIPDAVRQHLERGARGGIAETVKPDDARLDDAAFEIVGSASAALDAAQRVACDLGYEVAVLAQRTVGEARQAAGAFVAAARTVAASRGRPLCVLAAGETTVRVLGSGRGGRNQEFALAAMPLIGLVGRAAVLASAGTDGTDGPTDAAGAIVDSATLERAQRAGLDWQASLADNDAYHFFEPLRDLIVWGPTGTNVGDLQVMLIA
ncbi:MAG TPA: DUF4147 domain-containing protein, partial [Vicinamibacterales bacterium]|nr:DUF4147 domain-containing protein [Vicinamibacterales bacterium]